MPPHPPQRGVVVLPRRGAWRSNAPARPTRPFVRQAPAPTPAPLRSTFQTLSMIASVAVDRSPVEVDAWVVEGRHEGAQLFTEVLIRERLIAAIQERVDHRADER